MGRLFMIRVGYGEGWSEGSKALSEVDLLEEELVGGG